MKALAFMGAARGLTAVAPAFASDGAADYTSRRPAKQDRRFTSVAVEELIERTQKEIADPQLRWLFANCYPNTLDTTVEPGTLEGHSDTAVITGDIPAMWLRDSSAQVWPYIGLARQDPALRSLLAGVIRRQVRCILIDPYANAFMADLNAPPLEWSRSDKTEMRTGVGERKYELDSLCYPIRMAYAFWKQSGDTSPFDDAWHEAMKTIVATMQVQQRKHGPGPYHFQRTSPIPTETLANQGYGAPVNPIGLIASGFRPSDDACTFSFLVPANLFAVTSLHQLAEMVNTLRSDAALANQADALAQEVSQALDRYARVRRAGQGTTHALIWAYEVDGFGSQICMDDANVPSLLGLPYLRSSPDPELYAATRRFVWSEENPWFFQGSAGKGIGGPHEGYDMIWPMSIMIYALTSNSESEVRGALAVLKASNAGTGFMHESFHKNDAAKFTRPWFAWCNSLFGELVLSTGQRWPALLRESQL